MSYDMHITCRNISMYAEDGTYLDGDVRNLAEPHSHTLTFDPTEADTPYDWAVQAVKDMGAFEPSLWPIGNSVPAYAWLTHIEEIDPMADPGSNDREITVRFEGEFTDADRAKIFAAVL